MKIELEKTDLDYIDKINEEIDTGKDAPIFISDKNKKYYIEFKATDLAKANAFVSMLLNPNPDVINMLKEQCGIDVFQLSFINPKQREIDHLKNVLIETLDKLEE